MAEIEKPLVTFAVFTYNQERFVREAVKGAFSQDYESLEIILSDDYSSDRTLEIMKKMIRSYDGPHRIILNRNEANLGVGGHVNRILEMATGDLIVCAAGDDVSLPGRTREIVKAWEETGRKATSIYSDVININDSGAELGVQSREIPELDSPHEIAAKRMAPHGACHAFSTSMMRLFPPLMDDVVHEDEVIGFRSALIGHFHYIAKPLVKYRHHTNAISSSQLALAPICPAQQRRRRLHYYVQGVAVRIQQLADARHVARTDDRLIASLEKSLVYNRYLVSLFESSETWCARLRGLRACMRRGIPLSELIKPLLKITCWPVYARLNDRKRIRVIRRRLGA